MTKGFRREAETEKLKSKNRWRSKNQMEMILKEKDASDWIYRGEGGANLVLAYAGSYFLFWLPEIWDVNQTTSYNIMVDAYGRAGLHSGHMFDDHSSAKAFQEKISNEYRVNML